MKRMSILVFCAVCGLVAYAGEPYRGLPDGYQQVESLHSPGGKPIDLGVYSSAATTAELDYAPYTVNGNGDFGQLGNSDNDDYRLCPYSGGTFFDMGGRAGQSNAIHTWQKGNRQKIWMGAAKVIVNGEEELHPSFKIWNTDGTVAAATTAAVNKVTVGHYEMAAFGAKRNNDYYYAEQTVWSLRIWEAGTLVGDYVPAKCTLEGDANNGKHGLYDLVTSTFLTDSLGTVVADYTPGANVYGLKLSASATYDQSKNKAEVSFTAIQGEADVYVTITNILTGGAETTFLSREKAKKGDEWVHELDASSFSDGDTIGYRTVTNTVESFTIRTMTVTPQGAVSYVTKSDTNATLSATSTFVGDFSTSVDVYLAYAANGSELPEPTLAHAGVAVNTPVSLVLSNLLAETTYNYRVVFKNSQNGECEQSGSVTTYPVMFQPVADPDPTYTPGYTKFLNLPAEYTQLESLTSEGDGNVGQIVNTGIKSSNSITVELDYSPGTNHGGTDFGHNGACSGDYRFAPYGSGTFFDMGPRAGGPNVVCPVLTPGKRYTIWLGALNGFPAYTIYKEGGTLVGTTVGTSLATAGSFDMAAFGGFRSATTYTPRSMTIWSILIKNSGNLVGNFVPVMRNSDSEYGLYNLVNGAFCPDVTGTGFTASKQGAAVPGVSVESTLTYTDHWRLTLEVTAGSGDVYATSDDGDGDTKRILLMPEAKVGDSVTYDFTYLTAGKFYTIGYLAAFKDGDTTVNQYTAIKSVFNGSVTLSPTRDADEGNGIIGQFTVALADGVETPSDLAVAYTVDDSTTAVEGQTFATLSRTVTIPAGENSAKINVVPLWDEETATDTTVALKLAAGAYNIGTTDAQTIAVKSGESFGGWIYDAANQRIYDSDWQFIATDLGDSKLKIGNVNGDNSKGKVVTTPTPLDLSKVVVSSDGTVWTITETECCFATSSDSVLISAPYVSALTLPMEITRVGKNSFYGLVNAEGELTLPSTIVTIEQRAFYNLQKMTLDAADFPQNLLTLGHCAFHNFYNFTGDLNLPKVVAQQMIETFRASGLSSIHFGVGVQSLNGAGGQGVCYGCTSLTNVTFAGPITIVGSTSFNNCTALKELDFTKVTRLAGSNFGGSGLEKITLGTNLVFVSSNEFQNATHLQTIVFEGLPPTETFATSGARYLTGVAADQKVTTYIHKSNRATKNTENKCWLDYSANNSIMHTHTTFGSSFIVEGVDPAMRPLVTIEPTPGLKLIVR